MPTLTFPGLNELGCCNRMHDSDDELPDASNAVTESIRRLAGSVSLITAADDAGGRYGLTTMSTCPLSFDPPTLITCVHRNSPLGRQMLRTKHFCVNFPSSAQLNVAEAFLTPEGSDGFAHGHWGTGALGTPVLENAAAAFECTVDLLYAYPAYLLVVGQTGNVMNTGEPAEPLAHISQPPTAGHDERIPPPVDVTGTTLR